LESVRQESELTQHSDAVPAEVSRFEGGSEEPSRSVRRLWNSVVPIVGLVEDVAPAGEQTVYPAWQPVAAYTGTTNQIVARRTVWSEVFIVITGN
jgi:hypothetical protein